MLNARKIENQTEFKKELSLEQYVKKILRTKHQTVYFIVGENLVFKPVKRVRLEKDWKEKSFHIFDLNKAIEYMKSEGLQDFYITTSLHENRTRTAESALQFGAIVQDLDIYHSKKYSGWSPEEIVDELEEKVFGQQIPFPNIVVFSGNGVYLVYLLEYTPATKGVQLKRKVVNKIFYELLKEYGCDAKSQDLVHVFRPPGTLNGKSEDGTLKPVRAYQNKLPRYTLGQLAESLPNLWDVFKKANKIDKQKKKKQKTGKKSVSIVALDKDRQISYDMLQTVKKLAEIRGYDCEGYREMMLFMVRNYYHAMNRDRFYSDDDSIREKLFDESLEEAKKLNKLFKKPLPEEELSATLTDHTIYKFKMDTFYDWFTVDLDEAVQLRVKSKAVKNEKSKRQMRDLRGSKVGHDELHREIRQAILDNPSLGAKKVSELVKAKLGKCSENTVLNIKREMKEEGTI